MKIQKEEYKDEQNKETKELAKLSSLIYAVQSAAVFSNASNSNADTAAFNMNAILKRCRGIP